MVKMFKIILVCLSVIASVVTDNELFNVRSKLTFLPDEAAEYFGYTVVFTEYDLVIGAPKAYNRFKKPVASGIVFTCSLGDLIAKNVTCQPMDITTNSWPSRSLRPTSFFRDDMWYGATILTLPNDYLLVCAPRWKEWLNDKKEHLLALGACYDQKSDRHHKLIPLNEPSRNAYLIDGSRPEYGKDRTAINLYAYGQAGMAAKVVDEHRLIIGAPGLLMWTGSVVEYNYNIIFSHRVSPGIYFSKTPTSNPYYTSKLMPEDYFGYSVESGTFDNSSGVLYVAGAPRSQNGFGGVLIFEPPSKETDPMRIPQLLRGPHLGSYFGATLCSTDIDNDGKSDLLVGAPTYTKKDGKVAYDQGAVFVYMADGAGLPLILKSTVSGLGKSGARFGNAIADLGDVDGDGFRDIAVGAPFEDDGAGAVYIYRGCAKGLRINHVQRITEHSKGFGYSISKGRDVDGNYCNDLAVGAFNTGSAYLYRCVPTAKVHASIKVPDAVDLAHNTTNFKVLFCVSLAKSVLWPSMKIDLKAKITVDLEERRAMLSGDDEYEVKVMAGGDSCEEEVVEVKPTADLSRPISLKFQLKHDQASKNSQLFDTTEIRICEDSVMETSFQIQLTRDCGEDLLCKPLLVMTLSVLDSSLYIPGTNTKLGAKITIVNKEEPAFGAKVYLTLPLPPKRLPESCTLKDLNVTCNVPAPLRRNEEVSWEFELEYSQQTGVEEKHLKVTAKMDDAFYVEDITFSKIKEVWLRIWPVANFTVTGKPLPNVTVPVTRRKFNDRGIVNVVHYYEIINFGPSDWTPLIAEIRLPKNITLSNPIQGCDEVLEFVHCVWVAPARVSLPIVLTLKVNLHQLDESFEELSTINMTSTILLSQHNKTASVMSTLLLEPAPPSWPLPVGLAAGFVLLGAIIYGLYRYDFFSRQSRDRLRLLKEMETRELDEPGPSQRADVSTEELITEDSD